ncbi:DNA polymerase sliding clamp [Natronococcus jeotgali DSM 18795]|uniref:DNA polymerase sliding clamp n=1 Tax=Natronococcus jeotgali DSM 18795 TaxID=1227498 RepID=L9XKJ8_9EURY|nr:DNA polymerase sliding clamp [Natronococcus jeotgali DSM 18795]
MADSRQIIQLELDKGEEFFYIDAEGNTDDVHLELTREDLIDLQVRPAHSLFSLDYLKDMNKAIPGDSASEADLEAVGAAADVDLLEFEQLYTVIDPDAIDALCAHTRRTDGRIRVSDPPATAPEVAGD